MPTCPSCFEKYPDDAKTCAKDGASLVPDATFAHVDRDLAEGTVVGEYTIESKIGEGGFGAVYRAVHPLIGKSAAVKILSREFSANPQMVSRFVAEARAVNQIRHRNIIDIFSFGQLADGRQYYIMELLDGATFDAYLKKRGRLDLEAALPILRGIARALDAAHAKGILHRDLKPENIFLVIDEDGRIEPKLLDFGLVKLMSEGSSGSHKTKTGQPMGTPFYMSPEQSRGLEVDERTDVYSFGAMLFEILTGSVPYDGGGALDILIQHMNAAIPRASERCPNVPASLDAPIARMLAKDAADRPATVGEALGLLTQAAGIATDSARVVTPESGSFSIEERAAARTVIAPASGGPAASGGAAASGARGVTPATFLGTASEIGEAPAPKKSRALLAVAAAVGVLVVATIVVVGFGSGKKTEPRPQGVVATAPTVSASPSALPSAPPPPVPNDIEVRIEGVPDDTAVTANGALVGTGGGPFKLARGVPVKLVFVAKGWKPKELSLTPTESTLLSVTLEKAPAATTAHTGAHAPSPSSTIHSDLEGFDKKN